MRRSELTTEIWWLWLTYAPSLRFMQFMSNFIHWEEKRRRKNEKGKKEKDRY